MARSKWTSRVPAYLWPSDHQRRDYEAERYRQMAEENPVYQATKHLPLGEALAEIRRLQAEVK